MQFRTDVRLNHDDSDEEYTFKLNKLIDQLEQTAFGSPATTIIQSTVRGGGSSGTSTSGSIDLRFGAGIALTTGNNPISFSLALTAAPEQYALNIVCRTSDGNVIAHTLITISTTSMTIYVPEDCTLAYSLLRS